MSTGRARRALPAALFLLGLLSALAVQLAPHAPLLSLGGGPAGDGRESLVRLLLSLSAGALCYVVCRLPLAPRPVQGGWLSYAAAALLLLVAVNNFPFLALLSGRAEISLTLPALAAYLLATLATAVLEELLFRGVLLPLLLRAARMRWQRLLALLLSSLLFGLTHLLNLFSGAALLPTLLQVGYSTLIGAACAYLLLSFGSLLPPILFHLVYNFGGLFLPTFGAENSADLFTVLSTAALALLAGGAAIASFCRMDTAPFPYRERKNGPRAA